MDTMRCVMLSVVQSDDPWGEINPKHPGYLIGLVPSNSSELFSKAATIILNISFILQLRVTPILGIVPVE